MFRFALVACTWCMLTAVAEAEILGGHQQVTESTGPTGSRPT